jgi:hypothetical protein
MLLNEYRYYRVDEVGRFHDAEWFRAASDDRAIAEVRARHPGVKCQIWQHKRLVAKLSLVPFDPDDPEVQNAVAQRVMALAQRIMLGEQRWGEPARARAAGK